MKKLSITTAILLACISTTAHSKTIYYKGIENFTKTKDMYSRLDRTKQPTFHFDEKGVDLLKRVNWEVNNNIKYIAELNNEDYWQTPAETIKKGGGDCEDFAILKWKELLDNGIPETDMHFMIGFHKTSREFHTILVVILDNKLYYLDNTTNNLTDVTIKDNASYMINRFGVSIYLDDLKK